MRNRKIIEKRFRSSQKTEDGISDRGVYFFIDIIENQKLLLEILLDIRDIMKRNNGKDKILCN